MEELKKLRAQLMQVQKKQSTQRLTDRNIVDIVNKLVDNFSLNLVFTLSGKEYLTPKRLEQEIEIEVKKHGRLNLIDMPGILNVGVEQIEKHAIKIAQRSSDFQFINGQLIGNTYLDMIAQEINETLEETGQLPLSDLTCKYSLPMQYLKDSIESRIGTIIFGHFKQNNVLFTEVYIQRHLARLRGFLRGIEKPTELKLFDQSLTPQQIRELLVNKEVSGSYQNGIFTPEVHFNNIKKEINDFYEVNRYLPYDFVKKVMNIASTPSLKNWLNKEVAGGVHLENSYTSIDFIEKIKVEIKEILQKRSLINVNSDLILPSCIEQEDLENFVEEGNTIVGFYICNDKCIQKALDLFKHQINTASEETKAPVKGKKSGTPTIPKNQIIAALSKARFENADEDFLEALSEILYPRLSRLIIERQQQKNQTSDLESPSIVQDCNYLMVCCKSLGALSKKYTNLKPLKAHLTKTLITRVLHQLIEIQIKNQGFGSREPINSNNRQTMIERLPEYLRDILNKLISKMSAKDPEGFVVDLLENIKDIPVISVKQVDKKTERLITHKIKQELKQKLDECLNTSRFTEIVYYGLRNKLASNFTIDIPFEEWSLRILAEIYEATIGKDEILDTFKFVLDNSKSQEQEISEQIESMIQGIRGQLSN